MSQTIAISGKGGVGKTTIAALLIKYLAKNFTDRDILIIDGDPASNIPEVLGLETDLDKSISRVTYHLKQKIEKKFRLVELKMVLRNYQVLIRVWAVIPIILLKNIITNLRFNNMINERML